MLKHRLGHVSLIERNTLERSDEESAFEGFKGKQIPRSARDDRLVR